jgi:hypothetical protein
MCNFGIKLLLLVYFQGLFCYLSEVIKCFKGRHVWDFFTSLFPQYCSVLQRFSYTACTSFSVFHIWSVQICVISHPPVYFKNIQYFSHVYLLNLSTIVTPSTHSSRLISFRKSWCHISHVSHKSTYCKVSQVTTSLHRILSTYSFKLSVLFVASHIRSPPPLSLSLQTNFFREQVLVYVTLIATINLSDGVSYRNIWTWVQIFIKHRLL